MEPTTLDHREGPGLVASVLRHKWLVVAITLTGTILAYVLGGLEPERFDTSARLVLTDLDDSVLAPQQKTDPADIVRGEAQTISGRGLRELVANSLGLAPVEVRDRVSVTAAPETRTIIIGASGPSGELAAELANTVATVYRTQRKIEETARADAAKTQLRLAIDDINDEIRLLGGAVLNQQAIETQALVNRKAALEGQIVTIDTYIALFGDGVERFEGAEPTQQPSAPNPESAALIGLLLSALVAVAIAYWRAGRFDRVLTADDPASILGAPLLGEVPDLQGVPDARVAEAFLFVLSSVEFALQRIRGKSVLITSPVASTNKTESALHLSAAGARDGRETILVDGDIRHRALSRAIEIDKLNGLTELASGERSVEECIYNYYVAEDLSLPVVAAGRGATDTQSFVRTTGFRKAMLELKEEAELIVVDAAPLLSVADTSVIAGQVDGLVLVIERGAPVQQLIEVRERLAFVSAPLLGYLYINDSAPGPMSLAGRGKGSSSSSNGAVPSITPRRAASVGAERNR